MPKVAQHRVSGIVYNGWLGANLLFGPDDVIMCPLPLFHVFAVHVIWMAACQSGSEVVFPTPAGYRGEGVFDNFWKLLERHGVTFLITVPTAISALMQRPVDADVGKLKTAFSGSAPLPVELFKRFEKATGVDLVEGYGLTEATCLVSINPVTGRKKIGSVGGPFPYTKLKIMSGRGRRVPDRRGGRDLRGQPRRGEGRHLHRPGEERGSLPRGRGRALPAHGRSGADRPRGLHVHHRAGQGSHHPGRAQHRPGDHRGSAWRGTSRSPSPAPSASPTPMPARCPRPTWS